MSSTPAVSLDLLATETSMAPIMENPQLLHKGEATPGKDNGGHAVALADTPSYEPMQTVEATQKEVLTLSTLPIDILFSVFDILDTPSGVCLGLTCKPLWLAFKRLNPRPIDLGEGIREDSPQRYGEDVHGEDVLLNRLVGWMGPKYALVLNIPARPRCMCLSSDVYGDGRDDGQEDITQREMRKREARTEKLYERWQDYFGSIQHMQGRPGIERPYIMLPRPFNKGKAWYEEAAAVIRRDLSRHESEAGWVLYWQFARVFNEMRRDTMGLDEYVEWRQMIGF